MLRLYWFELNGGTSLPPGTKRGAGVAAFDRSDAEDILRRQVFGGAPPPIRDCIEDIDVSTLDPGHVLPNMAPPNERGVWFPLGYR